MKKEFLPGWGLMLLVGVSANLLSGLVEVGGRHPVEPVVVAILLGILLRNTGLVPGACRPGIRAFEKVLILGIVLIGAALDFRAIVSQGLAILLIVLVTMSTGLVVIYGLARLLKLPRGLSVLLTVGTTVCGGTAIAVTAPLIRAREEETTYAVGTIALWGLIAILVYPKLGQVLGAGDLTFGVFAGTAIHSTPQVVGAGFIFSELAGRTATAVKLVRNVFMVPIALLIAVWYGRRFLAAAGDRGSRVDIARAFPWFLFGYFIMAGLNTAGLFPPDTVSAFDSAGRFLILLGLAGIGLNTVFSAFQTVGFKPLVVGLLGSVVVAGSSILLIILLL
ncbi:MAG: putative sulfate exporter family transporter [bacterium]